MGGDRSFLRGGHCLLPKRRFIVDPVIGTQGDKNFIQIDLVRNPFQELQPWVDTACGRNGLPSIKVDGRGVVIVIVLNFQTMMTSNSYPCFIPWCWKPRHKLRQNICVQVHGPHGNSVMGLSARLSPPGISMGVSLI